MKGPNMPRAVKVWTWRRALRDHGPRDKGLRLTLYTLGTFMDDNGFAYPSQKTLARSALVSDRTIRRHLEDAEHSGWVAIQSAGRNGQGWRHHGYRAAVPSHVPLSEKDERLSDALVMYHGEIERADTTMSAPSSPERADTTSTDVGTRPDNVRTTDVERADTAMSGNVRTQLCPTNSLQRTHALREGALASTHHNQSKIPEASKQYRLPDLRPLLSRASPATNAGAVGYSTDEDFEALCEEYGRLEIRMVSERLARLRAWEEYDDTQPPLEDTVVAGGGYSNQDLEAICEEREWTREFLLQACAEYEATDLPEAV